MWHIAQIFLNTRRMCILTLFLYRNILIIGGDTSGAARFHALLIYNDIDIDGGVYCSWNWRIVYFTVDFYWCFSRRIINADIALIYRASLTGTLSFSLMLFIIAARLLACLAAFHIFQAGVIEVCQIHLLSHLYYNEAFGNASTKYYYFEIFSLLHIINVAFSIFLQHIAFNQWLPTRFHWLWQYNVSASFDN